MFNSLYRASHILSEEVKERTPLTRSPTQSPSERRRGRRCVLIRPSRRSGWGGASPSGNSRVNAVLFHHMFVSMSRSRCPCSVRAGAKDDTVPIVPAGSACQRPSASARPITDLKSVPAPCPYGIIRRTVPCRLQEPTYSASNTVHIFFPMSPWDMMLFPGRVEHACERPRDDPGPRPLQQEAWAFSLRTSAPIHTLPVPF